MPPAIRDEPPRLDRELDLELDGLAVQSRLRTTYSYAGSDRAHPLDRGGQRLLSFCSNDYLGLAGHPAVADALSRAAAIGGVGSGAARLVSGESPEHLALEGALAAFVRRPTAL